MGLEASWIAVKGGEKDAVLDMLGLVETGEIDPKGDAQLSCAELDGWFLVWAPDVDFMRLDHLRDLSQAHEVLGVRMSESITHSAAFGYAAGDQVWAVLHEPEDDRSELDVDGTPPADFEAIRDRRLQEQARENERVDHIFDVPLDLSVALCGFRPDDGSLPIETTFKILERVRTGAAGQRQAAVKVFLEALAKRIQDELFPIVEGLGFAPIGQRPAFHRFYPFGAPNTFVRERGEWSDCMTFHWSLQDNIPRLGVDFFVRRGVEPRFGRSGWGHVPPKPLSLLERFTGRKLEPEVAIGQVIEQGRQLLAAVDLHLIEGVASPYVRPAIYRDAAADRAAP